MTLKTIRFSGTEEYLREKYLISESIYLTFYFSWWIANLGVVPLLLFAAFLFFPALVFLRARLFFVTHVFDTILNLLQRKQVCILRRIKYLPSFNSSVKAFSVLFLLFTSPAQAELVKALKNHTLILSIGGIKEIHLDNLDHFSIGNNDSVSHKFNAQKKRLLIKAKSLGLSELHVWKKDGSRSVYQIYVLSRTNLLKLLTLAESLKSLGLDVETKGPWVHVSGELSKTLNYKRFLRIKKNNEEKLQIEVKLSKKLKKSILTNVIKNLFDDRISGFRCHFANIELTCHLSDKRSPSPEVEKFLKEKFGVTFIRHLISNRSKNYRLRIKIIQIESTKAIAHSTGLYQLSGTLNNLFEKNWQSLYENNKVQLKSLGADASLLAEPSILIRPDRKVKIQVGSEIPYHSITKEGNQSTQFKFAGLKLSFLLSRQGDGLLIDYSSEITKPGNAGSISGSKESASARLRLNEPIELFEVSFQTDVINEENLPVISEIPVFGSLFKNKKKSKTYKKITGVVLLEEN